MPLEFKQKITLDFTVSRIQNVHCSQDDSNSRNILITLSDNGKPYCVSQDDVVCIKISKPDHTYIYIDDDDSCMSKNNDGTISLILSEQATCVPGKCDAELKIVSRNSTVTSACFHIIVRKSVLEDKDIESSIESNIIEKMIQHLMDKANPHKTDKIQIGLGNVPNVTTNDQTPTYIEPSNLNSLSSGETLSTAFGKISKAISEFITHITERASISSYGHTKLVDSVMSTSTDTSATPNSVKIAYDKATSVANDLELHNLSKISHPDIREFTETIESRLNALADSDDETLDQLSEIVAYIKNNKGLIDGITTSKVSISDIIDNLTSSATNKPLSAKQGKVLRELIDEINLENMISKSKDSPYYYYGNIDELLFGEQGAYWIDASNVSGTQPTDGFYQLEVIASSGGVVVQVAHKFNNCKTFYRMYTNSRWYDWTLGINEATTTEPGLMSAEDKIKLDNASSGNVTGVKGNAESAYRTGNVNLTPADIGLGNVANERQYSASNPQPSVTGSSGSCTGNAATATALTTNAGSAAQPVYFSGGKPIACTAYASASVNYANSAGTATKATQDGNGRNIVSTYYPKTGGTVNGNVDIPNARWFTTRNKLGLETILLGMNSSNNIHMGDYNGADESPVYMHAKGSVYDFLETTFRPNTTGAQNLGDASHLWKTIHAKTGTINTSDRTKKHDIHAISEVYERLFLSLQPKSFMFDDGDRVHIGAISQDVEDAMKELGIEPEQFAGFCKDVRYEYTEFNEEDGTPVEASKVPCTDEDGNLIYDYALRYQEFIFLTIHMTQRLWEKTALLEKENMAIKDRLKNIEKRIEQII